MYQHCSHWTDVLSFWYWEMLWKICRENPNFIKIWHFPWRPKYVLLLLATLNNRISALLEWNGIWLLRWLRRYKYYANAPLCCLIHTLLVFNLTFVLPLDVIHLLVVRIGWVIPLPALYAFLACSGRALLCLDATNVWFSYSYAILPVSVARCRCDLYAPAFLPCQCLWRHCIVLI